MIRAIRRILYRCGFRPARGSIFYSPSLAWVYSVDEARQRDEGTR